MFWEIRCHPVFRCDEGVVLGHLLWGASPPHLHETNGYNTLEVDVIHGEVFDLTCKRAQRKLLKLCRRGRIGGVAIDMPCTSFSQARNRTRVIRTRQYPRGVPDRVDFSLNDLKTLELGNIFAKFVIRMIRIVHRRSMPWFLENPWSSRAWDLPEIREIMKWKFVDVRRRIDVRGYSGRWKEPTGLLSGHCDDSSLCSKLSRRCGGRHGNCSFQCRKRIILSGSAPRGGEPWTRIAQAYPKPLANSLAEVFCSSQPVK